MPSNMPTLLISLHEHYDDAQSDVLFALHHQALQNTPKYLPMHKDGIV